MNCQICNKEVKNTTSLTQHILNNHSDVTLESYWRKYIGPADFDVKCPACKVEDRKFLTIGLGYSVTCKNRSCSAIMSSKNTVERKKKESIKVSCKCRVCGKEFESMQGLQCHLFGGNTNCHNDNVTPKNYYLSFLASSDFNITCPICKTNERTFISMIKGFSTTCKDHTCAGKYAHSCRIIPQIKISKNYKEPIICQVCNKTVEGLFGLKHHLIQAHNHPDFKTYYDTYMKKSEEGICSKCKSTTDFIDIYEGYSKICTNIECLKIIDEPIFDQDLITRICKVTNQDPKRFNLGNKIYVGDNNFFKSKNIILLDVSMGVCYEDLKKLEYIFMKDIEDSEYIKSIKESVPKYKFIFITKKNCKEEFRKFIDLIKK